MDLQSLTSDKSAISLTLDFVNRTGSLETTRHSRYRERLTNLGLPGSLETYLLWFITLEEPPRDGVLFRVTSSSWFEAVCMWAIVLNALVIIYATDRDIQAAFEGTDTTKIGQDWDFMFELCFTGAAVLEILMKLIVHRLYFFVNVHWKMNLLDFTTVLVSVLFFTVRTGANVMHLRMSKAAKSARVLRLLRSFKYFQQLNLLVKCTVGALSSAFWCLVFLCVVVLVFAVVFVQAVAAHVDAFPEDKEEAFRRFRGTWFTMLRLFQSVSAGQDWTVLYDDLSMIGSSCQALLILYIAFCVLVMWNLISAIFVERALAFSIPDMESALTQRKLADEQDTAELNNLFRSTKGLDSKTPKRKFVEKMQSPEVQEFFSVRDITVTNADLFFTMLHASIPAEYASEPTNERDLRIDTSVLVAACLHMRGAASNFDLQALHWDIRRMHAEIHERLIDSVSNPRGVVAPAETPRHADDTLESSNTSRRSFSKGVSSVAAKCLPPALKTKGHCLVEPETSNHSLHL